MNKEIKINIVDEITLPVLNFDEIKENISNKDVSLISKDVASLVEVRDMMETFKKGFNKKMKEQFEAFDKNYKELNEYIDNELKTKLIDYVDKTGTYKTTTKTKLDKDGIAYDEKKETFNYDLPKGMVYSKGRTQYEYKEDLIPDEYKKLIIEKTKVKKAVEEGKLDKDVLILKKGNPSISFTLKDIKEGIKND